MMPQPSPSSEAHVQDIQACLERLAFIHQSAYLIVLANNEILAQAEGPNEAVRLLAASPTFHDICNDWHHVLTSITFIEKVFTKHLDGQLSAQAALSTAN